MSGKRFQARATTVQRLGRDGLVERNMATGEEKRVSQRAADVSFGPDRAVEQAVEEAVYAVQAPSSVPEMPVPDAPSMRMAADAPMLAAPASSEDPPPPPPASRRRRRNNRKKSRQRQAAKFAAHSAAPIASERRRLHFEDPPPSVF